VALPCGGDNRWIKPFLRDLGFALTTTQTRVLREVRQDLRGAHPMRRLLQGDVGSGKTLVAACSALMALESGFNVALMAPTEVLAEQHHDRFRRWFERLEVAVELHTGSQRSSAGESAAGRQLELHAVGATSAPHSPRLVLFIGTHALLDEAFV